MDNLSQVYKTQLAKAAYRIMVEDSKLKNGKYNRELLEFTWEDTPPNFDREWIQFQIDAALDSGNKELFMQLSEKLNDLENSKKGELSSC